MSIFTSQKRNIQDLPKPASFEFGSVKHINISEIKETMISPLNNESGMKTKKQIFVKMDYYNEALDTINKIREKVKDADVVLNDLRNMKEKEDQHISKWHKDLEDIRERLNKMDEILYEIENE